MQVNDRVRIERVRLALRFEYGIKPGDEGLVLALHSERALVLFDTHGKHVVDERDLTVLGPQSVDDPVDKSLP